MEEKEQIQRVEQETLAQPVYQEKVADSYFKETLDGAISALSRYGGFSFLETAIDGLQNLNPERKARKKMFLVEEQKEGER